MPSSVRLTRTDPTRNMSRFYLMDIQPNLLGEWCLVRENGRIGSPGQVRETPFPTLTEAEQRLSKVKRDKERKGYK